jgi:heat shock protein HtpX
MNREAETMHQAIEYPLPQHQRIEWRNFAVEAFLWAAPWICALLLLSRVVLKKWLIGHGIQLLAGTEPIIMIVGSASWLMRIWYRYRGDFEQATVGRLIEDVEVSQMRTRAVTLSGKILGRGVPGAFWSPDLVLQDSTGIVFVLYRPSIPFARFLFATTAAENYIDQEVVIEGWSRRGLRPYVEMSKISNAHGESHRAYSRWIQYAGAGISLVIGVLLLFS